MRFVIVTGMSGAGKSTALKLLEDLGYFCADNLPLPLVEKFAELSVLRQWTESWCEKEAPAMEKASGCGKEASAGEKTFGCGKEASAGEKASGCGKEAPAGEKTFGCGKEAPAGEKTFGCEKEAFAERNFSGNEEESLSERYSGIALGIDIRSGREITKLPFVLERLTEKKIGYEILYLDAADPVLLKRFKETRRSHPLTQKGRIDEGIRMERTALEFLKRRADYIIDTSTLLTRELRGEMEKIFVNRVEFRNIYVTVLSFGFKYGIPADSDLVFDVRFLPNPYYVDELRHKTGREREVQEYVLQSPAAQEFLQRLVEMVEFLLPHYVQEGKNQLVVSIGCTGGKHRSVTMAEQLYRHLSQHPEYGLKLTHRDIRN